MRSGGLQVAIDGGGFCGEHVRDCLVVGAHSEPLEHYVHDSGGAVYRHRLRGVPVPLAFGAVVPVVVVQGLLLKERRQQIHQLVPPVYVDRDVEAGLELLGPVLAVGAHDHALQEPAEDPAYKTPHDVVLRHHRDRVVGVLRPVAPLDERLEEVLQEDERIFLATQTVLLPNEPLYEMYKRVLQGHSGAQRPLDVRLQQARDAYDLAHRVGADLGVGASHHGRGEVGRVREHLQDDVNKAYVDARVEQPARHLVELLVVLGAWQPVDAECITPLQGLDELDGFFEGRIGVFRNLRVALGRMQLAILEEFDFVALLLCLVFRLDEADVAIMKLDDESRLTPLHPRHGDRVVMRCQMSGILWRRFGPLLPRFLSTADVASAGTLRVPPSPANEC
ncbi:2-octaprenyl-3-methyl-6-methoxy-1,4-benzoquinol hydroxylase, putative [Babesia ovata]|uniref:2-octaprenyl-3-methyl-6-methoxy-1,4-benzoquinol hydroxylase, putative n=1 Tax=Babesia ovata TaxID=189622 RepID=A0A2H6K7N6_9APIC|nr:2-octaprenyl-3-methyl-6-methoxy-1,4-benzoquinol hydroxylase, putative [Babesia ovata]GBE59007.1 2-octaprenyl-3-methyl-6-methoxy-1,4-benzoquinol hydroxylase, putative [Babesia ovata]